MSLTKVTYSMIKDGYYDVLDYAGLAETVNAKLPSNPTSHLFTSFLCWNQPIQAALDACYAAGGGTVLLPKNSVPYYLNDTIYIKDNTTLICEDWLVLADYTSTGGAFMASGSNIMVQNLMLDNSNIYTGGSGENGIGAGAGASGVGKNIKFYGGIVKNCKSGNNDDGTGDGGKGVQLEPGDGEDILIDGMSFSHCFMAMSTIRDSGTIDDYYGILYNNITADNCKILFFARQVGLHSTTGLKHTVQLNNFYAVDCGAFEGVIQLSRASNVVISNGIVVVDPLTTPQALIRGHHENCTFDNMNWYGDTASAIVLDPSTYAPDDTYPVANNVYNLNILGTVDFIADASVSYANRTLTNCTGRIVLANDLGIAFFGYELRNGISSFLVCYGTKQVVAITNFNEDTGLAPDFSSANVGYNIPVNNGAFYQTFNSMVAANVPNNTMYLDSGTGKLSFKDSGGTVHALY